MNYHEASIEVGIREVGVVKHTCDDVFAHVMPHGAPRHSCFAKNPMPLHGNLMVVRGTASCAP